MAVKGAGGVTTKIVNEIDRNSPVPYYAQLKEILREQIELGNWKPGSAIPGEPELCRLFDVSRTVVRQALREMAYEGLVIRKKGKGTFIAEPKISESLIQDLTGFYEDMVARGLRPLTKVLKQEIVPASAKVAGRLAISPGDPVVEIVRLRSIQREPMLLVTTYLPSARCPNLVHADLANHSLYAYLEDECHLTLARGHRSLEAILADEQVAELLGVKKGSPLILLESVSYLTDGAPIEYFHALHRGDRSRFEVELIRVRHLGRSREPLSQVDIELPRGSGVPLDLPKAKTRHL